MTQVRLPRGEWELITDILYDSGSDLLRAIMRDIDAQLDQQEY